MSYLRGYLEALTKCEDICKSYLGDLRKQAGPAKITVACINNIVDFIRDDIQAHALAIREDYGVPNPKQVFSMGVGKADHAPPLDSDLGGSELRKKNSLGIVKGFGRGPKKGGS